MSEERTELDLRTTIEAILLAWKERIANLNEIKEKPIYKNPTTKEHQEYIWRVEGKLIELDFCIRDLERQLNA